MIVRLTSNASDAERAAVRSAIAERGIGFSASAGEILLASPLADDAAVAVAAMPGVASVERSRGETSVGEALLLWVAGATALLGGLVLLAANTPGSLGHRADPLRTPGALRPSWPLLPWYSAVDQAPAWLPISAVLVVAAVVLFLWPRLGRGLAERRPALHTALGVAVLLLVLSLGLREAAR
jgi:hypothetical protein